MKDARIKVQTESIKKFSSPDIYDFNCGKRCSHVPARQSVTGTH